MKATRNRLFNHAIALLTIALTGYQTQAATLSVCQSGCAFSLPSQAYNAAAAGDIIEIQPGTYSDCIYIQKNNLTITGVNGMPKMINNVCGQKGILVTAAQNLTIKNLELSGATNNDNYAGIRHDAAGFNLTLDNVYIHDNDDGILASSSGDTITINNSRFSNNGMDSANGMAHNLYIGNAALVKLTNTSVTSAKRKGHELKSRAARTEVYSSTIATLGGTDSRLIDISNGGVLIVQDSVLQKSPLSDNNEMIAYAPEGLAAGRTTSASLTGNKIIGDRTPTDLIVFFTTPSSITISNNTLVAIRTLTNAGSPVSNTVFASRSAVGYQAYPWLPAPGAAPAPAPAPSWIDCAAENGTCTFSGTRDVRYGANNSWSTKTAVTGSIGCNNSTFGDPIPGTVKTCQYSSTTVSAPAPAPAPAPAWTKCANEGGTCFVSGTRSVRYGANGVYITKTVTGSIACDNNSFGGDPAYGTAKTCEYSADTTTTITWTTCSNEGGTCSVSGTRDVRYGINGSWLVKTVTGSTGCDNGSFGGDPAYGTAKICQYSSQAK